MSKFDSLPVIFNKLSVIFKSMGNNGNFVKTVSKYPEIFADLEQQEAEQVKNPAMLSESIVSPEYLSTVSSLTTNKSAFDEINTLAGGRISTTLTASQWLYYDVMILNDSVINSCYEFRRSKIANTEFQIVVNKDDAKSVEAGDMVSRIIYDILGQQGGLNFEQLLKNTLTALIKGFSATELIYGEVDNKLIPVRANDWGQNNFSFDQYNQMRWTTKKGATDTQGVLLENQNLKWIIHKHNASQENPYGSSILGGRCFWAYYMKRKAIISNATLCDRYGYPYIIAELDESLKTMGLAEKTALFNILKNLARQYAAVVPKEAAIKIIEAGATGANSLKQFLLYLDKEIAVSMLGQALTLSSEGGGSYARDTVAYQISDDIFKADVKELQNTLNNFIRFVVSLNFGLDLSMPTILFKADNVDTEKRLRIFTACVDLGVPVSLNQIAEECGIRAPEEGEEIATKAAAANNFGFSAKTKQKPVQLAEPKPERKSILKLTEKAAIKDMNQVKAWEDIELKKLAKLYTPVLNAILDKAAKVKSAEQVSNITIDPVLLAPITNKYLDDQFFLYLYGQSSSRKQINAILNTTKKNTLFLNQSLVELAQAEKLAGFLPYAQAIQYFNDRLPLPMDIIEQLTTDLRARAFWMSRASSYRIVIRMQELIQQAIEEGYSPQKFIEINRAELSGRLGFDIENPWYLNTVYRTNVATAYQAGQWQQINEPATKESLPFWQYVSVMDDRTTPICIELAGKVYPADSEVWSRIYPPNHFNCRSTVTAINREIIRDEGLKVSKEMPKDIAPSEGFDTNNAVNYLTTLPVFSFNVPAEWGVR